MFICFLLQKKFFWPTLAYALQKSFYEPVHTAHDIQTFPLCENTEGRNPQPAYTGQLEKSTTSAILNRQLPVPAAQAKSNAPNHSLLSPSTTRIIRRQPQLQAAGSRTALRVLTRRRCQLSGQTAAALGCRWSTVIDAHWLPRQLLGSSASYFC